MIGNIKIVYLKLNEKEAVVIKFLMQQPLVFCTKLPCILDELSLSYSLVDKYIKEAYNMKIRWFFPLVNH